jgi:uncharacterized protein YkwD
MIVQHRTQIRQREKMKTTISVLAICLTTACGGAGGSMSNAPSAVSISLAAVDAATDRSFAGMLNDVRAVNGSGAVTYDSRLGTAAQRHADDMLANDFFDHVGSDGSTVGSRVTDAGYRYSIVGENIGKGYADEEAILRGWITSPGHQRNNVNPRFEDFALAKTGAGSNRYWVLVLASEL